MELEKAKLEILTTLFANYKQSPGSLTDIHFLSLKYKIDSVQLSEGLKAEGLIKNLMFLPKDAVVCKITINGILEIDSQYVHQLFYNVINGMGEAGGKGDIVLLLKTDKEHYQIVLDTAHELVRRGLIKIQSGAFETNQLIAELTLNGKIEFETKTNFF